MEGPGKVSKKGRGDNLEKPGLLEMIAEQLSGLRAPGPPGPPRLAAAHGPSLLLLRPACLVRSHALVTLPLSRASAQQSISLFVFPAFPHCF